MKTYKKGSKKANEVAVALMDQPVKTPVELL